MEMEFNVSIDPMMPSDMNVVVSNIARINIDKVLDRLQKIYSEKGMNLIIERPLSLNEEEDDGLYSMCIENHSAQNVTFQMIHYDGIWFAETMPPKYPYLVLDIPELASDADVELCFALLREIKALRKNAKFRKGCFELWEPYSLDDGQMSKVKGIIAENLKKEISESSRHDHKVIRRDCYAYTFPCADDYPNLTLDQIAEKVKGEYVDALWNHVARVFIMRWNPEVSNLSVEEYAKLRKEPRPTLRWSIWNWQEARKGDLFVMMREGKENPGIIFHGEFLGEPFLCESWRDKGKMEHCIELSMESPTNPVLRPLMSLEELTEKIPDMNWRRGHSGVLLTQEQSKKLMAAIHSMI